MFTREDRQALQRIEAKVQELIAGLAIKEQLNRIETLLATVSLGGMTEEEVTANTARLRDVAARLQDAAAEPKPSS